MLIAVIFLPPFQTKYLEQSKEIQQNKTGLKNFDIYFCVFFLFLFLFLLVFFDRYIQSLISGRETGH